MTSSIYSLRGGSFDPQGAYGIWRRDVPPPPERCEVRSPAAEALLDMTTSHVVDTSADGLRAWAGPVPSCACGGDRDYTDRCDACRGTGLCTCSCGHEHDCADCDGEGRLPHQQCDLGLHVVDLGVIGEVQVNRRLVAMAAVDAVGTVRVSTGTLRTGVGFVRLEWPGVVALVVSTHRYDTGGAPVLGRDAVARAASEVAL